MTKRQRMIVNFSVLYVICIVLSGFMLLLNPFKLQRVQETTLFDMALNSDVPGQLQLYLGIRDFYVADVIVITPQVIEILERDVAIDFLTDIDDVRIEPINAPTGFEGNQDFEAYTLNGDLTVRFYTTDSRTLYVFEQDGMIVVMGGNS